MPITLDGSTGINSAGGGQVNGVNAYALRKVTYLTTPGSGTYTTPANVRALRVTCVGGGGGGGGVDGQGAGTSALGGHGGGGGTVIKFITSPAASYSYTVGAGGAGGAAGANNGTAGGNTTFSGGSISLQAGGGDNGGGLLASASQQASGVPAGSSSASGGDVNFRGGSASSGLTSGGSTVLFGLTGTSLFSTAIRHTGVSQSGQSGMQYGGGGQGATVEGVSANYSGGAGADGLIIIEELF